MRTLIMDPACGMAGDMCVAALAALGADHKKLTAIMETAASSIGGASVGFEEVTRGDASGLRLKVKLAHPGHSANTDALKAALVDAFTEFGVAKTYQDIGLRALDALTQAEAKAHGSGKVEGMPATDEHGHVHLHEAQDIVIDIAGVVMGLADLDVDPETITALMPVRFGGGTVTFSHGTHAVPAPATRELIEAWSIPVEGGPVEKELLTPTGASLLAAMVRGHWVKRAAFKPNGLKLGLGMGTLEFPQALNALTLYLKD